MAGATKEDAAPIRPKKLSKQQKQEPSIVGAKQAPALDEVSEPLLGSKTSSTGSIKQWAEEQQGCKNVPLFGGHGILFTILSTLMALFIMAMTPFMINLVYAGFAHDNYSAFDSLWSCLIPGLPTWQAAVCWLVFGAFQALLQLVVPGREVMGPITPKGNRPKYPDNGLTCYLITMGTFALLWATGLLRPAAVYDIFGDLLTMSFLCGYTLCVVLYLKGRFFPSSSDAGVTGNVIFDLFWGTELYPRFGTKFDIKVWTNCRMGMMSWPLLITCFAAKHAELHNGTVSWAMLVTCALMHVYVFKFFMWESGYMSSMDIAHDRAGYYLCFGCLCFVPCVYTSPAFFLVRHDGLHLDTAAAIAMAVAGMVCIALNYDCDYQRQLFRDGNGNCTIWGRAPSFVKASYITSDGSTRESNLLTSGWWGVARHMHYTFEVAAAGLWTLPCGFESWLPWFYLMFLTGLLVHRVSRQELRCLLKYGDDWRTYCNVVRWKLIPLIY